STWSRTMRCNSRSKGPSNTAVCTSYGKNRRIPTEGPPLGAYHRPMARVLSGIQPTGDLHLGNYLGAVRHWAQDQHEADAYFCVVDLHALTIPREPGELRAKTAETALVLIAAGLDP